MRENKYFIYISGLFLIISLIGSFLIVILQCYEGKGAIEYLYDILLAILGSALVSFVFAIISYRVFRRYCMEEFWLSAIDQIDSIRNLKRFNTQGLPVDLVAACVSKMSVSKIDELDSTYEFKELLEWYKNNFECECLDEKEYSLAVKHLLGIIYRSIKDCVELYLNFADKSISSLTFSYGRLDYIMLFNNISKATSHNIYNEILRLKNCVPKFNSFYALKEGACSYIDCMYDLLKLNKVFFNDDVNVGDFLDEKAEIYRKSIYWRK